MMPDRTRTAAYLTGTAFVALAAFVTIKWIGYNPHWTYAEALREMWPFYTAAFLCAAVVMLIARGAHD
jgi:hypothetical protein